MLVFAKRFIQIILIVGITLGIPVYALVMAGCFLWFKTVTYLGRRFRQFELPVTGVATFLAPDKLHERPTCTLVHLAVLQGLVSPETVSSQLQCLYESKKPDGSRPYKKLGLSIDRWLGYTFWKTVADFNVKDHVHVIYNENNVDKENVATFVEGIIQKPFTKGRPIWDCYILYNNNTSESYVIFRTHHLLLDGMSLLKLWYKADGSTDQIPTDLIKFCASTSDADASQESNFSLKRMLKITRIILLLSPYITRPTLNAPPDNNCITKPFKNFDGNWYCSKISKIHLGRYRQPLRDLKFSLTHALLTAYTRGLGRFIQKNYSLRDVPNAVHLFGSVPRPNYPNEALTNHWAFMRYKATQLVSTNVREQLEHAKVEYRRCVQDIIPEAFELNHTVFGPVHLPGWFYKFWWQTKNTGTFSLSNIPGPKTEQKMFGLPVTDRNIWLPLTRNNSGIGLLFLTYNGWGYISMTADSGCIKNRALFEELNRMVLEEMEFVLEEVVRMASEPQILDEDLHEVTIL